MDCRTIIKKLHAQKSLNTKFVLSTQRKELGEILKYKARVEVCGNEENDFNDDSFVSAVDLSTKKLGWLCVFAYNMEGKSNHKSFSMRSWSASFDLLYV